MANSLQDQLLRAGVIDKQKAQQAKVDRRKKQKLKHKGATSATDNESKPVQAAQAEKLARDRELNRRKQEEVEQKAIAAQVRQLVELNRLSRGEGELPYNFVDGKNVRKIYVTESMLSQLGRGLLVIARFDDGYEVIPASVAVKINERDTSVVISNKQPESAETNADDPYADYKVPDDLMW